MGFWDTVGKIVKGAGNIASDMAERHNNLKDEMSKKSDEQLFSIVDGNKSYRAKVAAMELKNRGYDSEDIRILMATSMDEI